MAQPKPCPVVLPIPHWHRTEISAKSNLWHAPQGYWARIGRIKGILSHHPGSLSPAAPNRWLRPPSSQQEARFLSVPNAITRSSERSRGSREPRLPLPSWSAKNGHRRKKTTEFGSGDHIYQPYPLDTPCPTAHTADAHVTQGGMGKERICQHRWC
jgi:hypothetical protein